MRKLLIFVVVLLFIGCKPDPTSILPNDIRWVQDSEEYEKVCEQIYYSAWMNWSQFKSEVKHKNAPLAIVMDLDETVLDNTQYQVELQENGEAFSIESWSKWVIREEAGLVPGAKEFIDKIHDTGNIRIIFISNRMAERTESTINNMKKFGLYYESDIYLLRKNKKDLKSKRRSEVTNGSGRMTRYGPQVVIAYFGDSIADFPKADKNYIWSKNMFMLPNPMYGKW